MNFANLTGMKALVTGGSRGIGKAIAESLAVAGADVTICGTNESALKKVADELNVDYFAANLADNEALEALIAHVGSVDILVNNAGVTADGLFIKMDDAQWDKVMDINFTAARRLTKAFAPTMMKAGFGRVINISSVVASMGNTGQANYIASKAAIEGLTRGLAKEMARKGLTFNCVAPGFIATEMTDNMTDKAKDGLTAQIPARKLGAVEDVAAAVRFLASKDAGYINGAVIPVNGGLYL